MLPHISIVHHTPTPRHFCISVRQRTASCGYFASALRVHVALVPFLYSRFQTKISKRIPPTTARESQTHKWNVAQTKLFTSVQTKVILRLCALGRLIREYFGLFATLRKDGRGQMATLGKLRSPTACQLQDRKLHVCRGSVEATCKKINVRHSRRENKNFNPTKGEYQARMKSKTFVLRH